MAGKVLIDKYLETNDIYKKIGFSYSNKAQELLPNIFVFTQYIIDQFINNGEKRIAIVLPSEDWNIYPLLFTKALMNAHSEENTSDSIIYNILPGQKLRLGKAVVQFQSLDQENNRITFIVGKTDPTQVSVPISGFVYMFEKCEGALSKWETWIDAYKQAKYAVEHNPEFVSNRTTGKNTLMMLTSKNDFKKTVAEIKVNNQELQSLITYGEIDLGCENNFKLYNKGKLNCIPAISVSSKLSEMSELLETIDDTSCINSIYVTNDKISEIVNNNSDFISCLRTEIPFVVFLAESDYENIGKLHDYGFKLWHWKPSTINNKVFIQKQYNPSGVFGNIPEKVKNAATASFSARLLQVDQYKQNLSYIKKLSKMTEDKDSSLRQITRMIWAYQNNLKSLSFINGNVIDSFNDDLRKIEDDWNKIKASYKGQELYDLIEYLIKSFSELSGNYNFKESLIKEILMEEDYKNKKVLFILPDKDYYERNINFEINSINKFKTIDICCLNEFYRKLEKEFSTYDYVFVTWFDWFDRNDYLKIKQSYCYKKLIYILFDFENKWRNALIKQIDNFIPHKEVISNGKFVGLSKKDYLEVAFDFDEEEELEDKYTAVADLNYSRDVLNATIKSASDLNTNETIECIPVLLSNKKIAYFHPNHDVMDITALLFDDNSNPQKKEVNDIRKGDRILIRQSGKDIIHEKADELMKANHETGLRNQTWRWTRLLQEIAKKQRIKAIVDKIQDLGGSCAYQQLRYWLTGESICPRNQQTLIAIGQIYNDCYPNDSIDEKYLSEVNKIYEAGKKVQTYHQQAGRWLTKELKDKVDSIKAISRSKDSRGIIEGIGEITIYKVEDILEKTEINKWELNRIEDLF